MFTKHLNTIAVGAVLAVAVIAPAFGADADWIAPVSEGVTSLTASLVKIGGGLIGLAIVIYGLWAAMTQRIDGHKMWMIIIAGLLVTVGPSAITWFIDLMQAG